ncbi:MAG: hypothetical protein HYY84_04320 [Deltaproteobacteria bacterium]|nr:hypothetical protein [Deltaproteobacteria bacterium]
MALAVLSYSCPLADDCENEPEGIGARCPYRRGCGTCHYFDAPSSDSESRLLGGCRAGQRMGRFYCMAEVCEHYKPVRPPGPLPKPPLGFRRAPGTEEKRREEKCNHRGTETLRSEGEEKRRADRRIGAEAGAGSVAGSAKEVDLDMDRNEFKALVREVLAEEFGFGYPELGDRWVGGEIQIVPGKTGVQSKRIPIDAFFHKIVMLRDRLRVLEQALNAHAKLGDEEKVRLQGYITKCYGTLTTFNVLFADRADYFTGDKSSE